MSRIRSKDTKPEKVVRTYLYKRGVRYRLHRKDLPGKPDIIVSRINTVIFIHGCFWHHHRKCRRSNWPKSNEEYWKPKIEKNIQRDRQNIIDLNKLGWKPIVVWECETNTLENNRKINDLILNYTKSFT